MNLNISHQLKLGLLIAACSFTGSVYAECPPANYASITEKVTALKIAGELDSPAELNNLVKNYCIDPNLQNTADPEDFPAIFVIKSDNMLNAYLKNGFNMEMLSLQSNYPDIIKYLLLQSPYQHYDLSKEMDFINSVENKFNFQKRLTNEYKQNITFAEQKKIISHLVEKIPVYLFLTTDYMGLTPLTYLITFRQTEAIEKVLARNSLIINNRDFGKFHPAFSIFLNNCHVNELAQRKEDVKILKMLINNKNFNPVQERIPFFTVSINFLDALMLYQPDNKEIIDLLKSKGYEAELKKSAANVLYLRKVVPMYLHKFPQLNDAYPNTGYENDMDNFCINESDENKKDYFKVEPIVDAPKAPVVANPVTPAQ